MKPPAKVWLIRSITPYPGEAFELVRSEERAERYRTSGSWRVFGPYILAPAKLPYPRCKHGTEVAACGECGAPAKPKPRRKK